MQVEGWGQNPSATFAHSGFQGRGRGWGGMRPGRGQGQLICYNCRGPGHYARDFTNPTWISCPYCEKFDHDLLDCPMLLAQISEKRTTPPTMTQNVQMIRSEPCDEEYKVNMVLRGDATLEGDQSEMYKGPSMLTTFLETCMKLLRDNRVVKGLEEVINSYARWGEPCIVRRMGSHTSRTQQEMWLIVQIGNYEMDQVILDLGSDAKVLPKQMWEHIGKPPLQWSPIQLWMEN